MLTIKGNYGDLVEMKYDNALSLNPVKCRITKITITAQGIWYKAWEEPYGKSHVFKEEDIGKTAFLLK